MAEMAKRVVNNEKKRIFSTTKNYGFLDRKEILEKKTRIFRDECFRVSSVKDLALISRICLVHQPEDNLGQGSQILV